MQPCIVARIGDYNKGAAHILISSAQPLVSSNTSSPLEWSKANFAELNSIAIFSVFYALFVVHFVFNRSQMYISSFINVFNT